MDNVTFLLDLKIMWLTVWKVLTNADNENVGQTVSKPEMVEEKVMVEK